MPISTYTTEQRYPSRSRRQRPADVASTLEPKSAVAQSLANGNTKARAVQPRRIPALTTSRTFGQKSPVGDVDLQAFLAKCMSTNQWDTYSEEEKQSIVASLPATRRSQYHGSSPIRSTSVEPTSKISMPPITPAFCSDDLYLKRAIARFKRDLKDGYYEKSWQDKAKKAHEERLEGKFDEYIRQHTEEMFAEDDVEQDGAADATEESENGEYRSLNGSKGRKAKRAD